MKPIRIGFLVATAVAVFAAAPAAANDARSPNYRLIGSGPASIAAKTASPAYQALIVGGSGTPVGISASPNVNVNAGGTSTHLPTDRMFVDGLET